MVVRPANSLCLGLDMIERTGTGDMRKSRSRMFDFYCSWCRSYIFSFSAATFFHSTSLKQQINIAVVILKIHSDNLCAYNIYGTKYTFDPETIAIPGSERIKYPG